MKNSNPSFHKFTMLTILGVLCGFVPSGTVVATSSDPLEPRAVQTLKSFSVRPPSEEYNGSSPRFFMDDVAASKQASVHPGNHSVVAKYIKGTSVPEPAGVRFVDANMLVESGYSSMEGGPSGSPGQVSPSISLGDLLTPSVGNVGQQPSQVPTVEPGVLSSRGVGSRKRKSEATGDKPRVKRQKASKPRKAIPPSKFERAEKFVEEGRYILAYQEYSGFLRGRIIAADKYRANTAIARMRQWFQIDEIDDYTAYSYFAAAIKAATARAQDKASARLGCADMIVTNRVEGDFGKAYEMLGEVIADEAASARDLVYAKLAKGALWHDVSRCRGSEDPREICNMLGEVVGSPEAQHGEKWMAVLYKAKVGYCCGLINNNDIVGALRSITKMVADWQPQDKAKDGDKWFIALILMKEEAERVLAEVPLKGAVAPEGGVTIPVAQADDEQVMELETTVLQTGPAQDAVMSGDETDEEAETAVAAGMVLDPNSRPTAKVSGIIS